MQTKTIKTEAQNLLDTQGVSASLDYLYEASSNNVDLMQRKNDLILFFGRYNRLQREFKQKVISTERFELIQNRIKVSLIEFIAEL